MFYYMPEYIYLLHTREFITQNKLIYKIGKTKQLNATRFNNYPKGSELQFQIKCNNCDNLEKILIKEFQKKFIQQKEFGNEYFEGNYLEMIDIIYNNVKNIKNTKLECKLCKKEFSTKYKYQ